MTTWTKHRETQKLLEEAEAAGLEVELSNAGHILVRPPGASGGGTTVSKSPGDHREVKNARSQIRRIIQGINGECQNSWHLENSGTRFCPWCSGTWKDKDRPKPKQEAEVVRRDMNKKNVPQREKLECPTCPEWFWVDQKIQYAQHIDWCKKNIELKSQEVTLSRPLGDRIVEAVNDYGQPLSVDDIATLVNVTPTVAGRVLTDLVRIKKVVKKGTMFNTILSEPEKKESEQVFAEKPRRIHKSEIRSKIRTFLEEHPDRSYTAEQVSRKVGFTWDQTRWALAAMARNEPDKIQITSGKSRTRKYRWVTQPQIQTQPKEAPVSEVVFEDPPEAPITLANGPSPAAKKFLSETPSKKVESTIVPPTVRDEDRIAIVDLSTPQPPDPNKAWKWIPGQGFVEDVSVPATTVFEYITTDVNGRLLIKDDKGMLYFATPL